MYSDIVINSLKEDIKDVKPQTEEEVMGITVRCPLREELMYTRTFNNFIKEHKDVLDYIYEKQFKGFNHINKEDFYTFAYTQSSIDEQLTRSYRK